MRLDDPVSRGANNGVRTPAHDARVHAPVHHLATARRWRFLVAGLAPASLLVGASLIVLGAALSVTTPARQGIGLELPLQAAAQDSIGADAARAAGTAPSSGSLELDALLPSPAAADLSPPIAPTFDSDDAVPPSRDDTAMSPQPDPREGVPPLRATQAEDDDPEPHVEPEPDPTSGSAPASEQTDGPPPRSTLVDDVHSSFVALPTRVEIPRLGVDSDLLDLHLDAQGRLEVPADPALAGWWTGGPRPGQVGPAVIVGHVDSVLGPAVFHGLPRLAPGDEIVVYRADDTEVRFAVERVERWPKDGFPTQAVYREADGPELRLITCGGRFDRQALRYLDNVIVFARALPRDD